MNRAAVQQCRTVKALMLYCSIALLFFIFLPANAFSFEVEIDYEPAPAEAFQEIEFKAVVKGAEAKSFLWDMGDGTKYKEQEFTHIYKKGGMSYTITLTVTDAAGKTVTKKMTIDILRRKGGCPTA